MAKRNNKINLGVEVPPPMSDRDKKFMQELEQSRMNMSNMLNMNDCFSSSSSSSSSSPPIQLPGGDFLKSLFKTENKGHIGDILNALSAILGNGDNKNGRLRLTGVVDGAHIDMELTNLITLNMALNIINRVIENHSETIFTV